MSASKNKNLRKNCSEKGRLKKLTIYLLLIVSAITLAGCKSEPPLSTVTESKLQKVLEISELSTAEYTYNAVATAYTEDGEDVRYYVAYEGTVTAGIDPHEINVSMDEENINITLPKIEVQDTKVNIDSLEVIFEKRKYEKENIFEEVYQICKEDLAKRATEEQYLLDMARENAVSTVQALCTPFEKSYHINIQ